MDIYVGLPTQSKESMDDSLADVSAVVINQYIIEDNIPKDDKNDERVELMMRYAESFFLRFQGVITLQNSTGEDVTAGRGVVVKWMTELMPAMNRHAEEFTGLYGQVQHLAETHHATAWSMCYLVSTALEAKTDGTIASYNKASDADKEVMNYLLRFGENLLMEIQSRVLEGRV
jgi:hypothetical protein